jgi:hypothetical protein
LVCATNLVGHSEEVANGAWSHDYFPRSRAGNRISYLLGAEISSSDERVVLIALGIDSVDKKHMLGIHEGVTENAAACGGLLDDISREARRQEIEAVRRRWIEGARQSHSRSIRRARALI